MRRIGFFLIAFLTCSASGYTEVTSGKAAVMPNEVNGVQIPRTERGIAGVKIVSDTGAYAITDEDGKYHFPFLPVGQHILKIDASTLPQIPGVKREGFIPLEITTENPRKIVITPGVMTKVSFGVRPQEGYRSPEGEPKITDSLVRSGQPLLKTSIAQDAYKLQPHLSAYAKIVWVENEGGRSEKLEFTFNTNYHLFIQRAELRIWNEQNDYAQDPKIIELPIPLPLKHQIPLPASAIRYQLAVYDAKNKMDRTSISEWLPPEP